MSNDNPERIIDDYFSKVLLSMKLLYDEKLYSQMLTILFSSIDSYGFLDAPTENKKATSASFKEWVKKYMLINSGIEYNEIDCWASRCAVLHTHTSESDLSKKNKAREILFYSGDKFGNKAPKFHEFASKVKDGNCVSANIEETYLTFVISSQKFARDIAKKCRENPENMERLNQILQQSKW